ncbi:copper homeostasis periplasmic binding protein CopC [Telmatospirillum siberiense]|uniref:CopC domain-containing protein n=1 Tax=Telmatospirillum siberiense TaxID=382514 RepID=A0A2N3PRY5_9PROT|nr:copper homeostasis periplasmic binding protein CopC [Telmatospirillum siberiense]PKU23154.1 hypothetical protein CWS72_18180 [Telmatospirillum siberiense]
MMKVLTVLAVLAGVFSASPAFAHAHLLQAEPAVGAEVASAAAVRLSFSEGVEGKFSSITVTDAAGRAVSSEPARADPQDGRVLGLLLPGPLAPGVYSVSWSVVSVDTHRSSGHFTFTVRP